MLIHATPAQALFILRAMRAVVAGRLTDADRAALLGAHAYVFRGTEPFDPDALAPIEPTDLAAVLPDPDQRDHTAQFLTVMALVDGTVDDVRIARVLAFADALDVHADYVRELGALGKRQLDWVRADIQRQNLRSVTGRDVDLDEDTWLLPYQGTNADPALVARYQALGTLPAGSFGRAFFDFYVAYGFSFPGDPRSVNEAFARPHDSTHVLSGYDTTPRGELLVSTFTAGMHPQQPMSGHILPVILSWHCGIELVKLAGATTGKLDPRKFWVAWERGTDVTTDVFAAGWDFWDVASEPVARWRTRYGVPPLDPNDAAHDTVPAWYRPVQ
ncbi:MAG TPA: hypothetical protein VGR62_15580 [Candidatus Binatia bacterium]|jgi:hypothetical protein|nr:hypothetical protein [Candidatus Binatia bacterium]